jgi:hypothetical protein
MAEEHAAGPPLTTRSRITFDVIARPAAVSQRVVHLPRVGCPGTGKFLAGVVDEGFG